MQRNFSMETVQRGGRCETATVSERAFCEIFFKKERSRCVIILRMKSRNQIFPLSGLKFILNRWVFPLRELGEKLPTSRNKAGIQNWKKMT